MNEALKALRKSAETDIGGSGGQENATELKKVINRTTKLTKVARGTEQHKDEDELVEEETALHEKTKEESDEEERSHDDEDEVMDIDGI